MPGHISPAIQPLPPAQAGLSAPTVGEVIGLGRDTIVKGQVKDGGKKAGGKHMVEKKQGVST